MKSFKLSEIYSVICEYKETRAFKHTATILKNGRSVYSTKICYQNRTWEKFEFESVLHKAIENYFEEKQAKEYIKSLKSPENEQFKSVSMVCAMGKLFCKKDKDKNSWDKKMLSTIHGINFPEDFDSLPESEKRKRLDKALECIK